MMKVRKSIGLSLIVLVVAGFGLLLSTNGVYGLTLFLVVPIALGASGACVGRARTLGGAAAFGALAGAISSLGLLFLGVEGFACVIMALPLAVPLGAIGGLIYCTLTRYDAVRNGAAVFAILPLATFGFDVRATPPTFEIHSSIEVAAAPERVWRNVVTFSDIPEPQEWFFHTGLAYPKRARIEGTGRGAIRYCEFSTGPFVEPIQVWDEPHLLQFSVTSNPAPMHEWSPYGSLEPKHLHGYMISKQGQFRLTLLANGGTLLEGTTWYQHGLWPSGYWRVWSDAIIHRIHLRVLRHIKNLSESMDS